MSKLFSPLSIKNITLKNRIAVSPMCQYSAIEGFTNDWHLVHLGSRAAGGAGLVIMEATAVEPEGRITPGDTGIWNDDFVPGLKKITDFIHLHGSVAATQLAHAGRKASCAVPHEGGKQLDLRQGGWQTVAPSAIPFRDDDRLPVLLSIDSIKKIISSFKSAAERARIAGFKVVEIHSAHGYLLQEFLSPISNHRTDEYGGSFENRTRLLRQVIDAVKTVWPAENPLFVRISSTDWTDGGWTIEDSVKLAFILKEMGVDLIDCSSGGNVFDATIPFSPGYQVPFAEAIRKTGIMTGTVGLITSAAQAESILREEKADLILLGREMLRNPYFPLKAAKEMGVDVTWPVQYIRSK
ncbi:MAG: oxidoreductase [Bacteroidetes bacterium GWE2_41_25]|nr:MAG: oxidoreductase [Bacteroidetes bacterium GWA2_40_15]OFX84060.1 MAG: oxidoreductase [Bacteroidetes bacterium GWC2_40_22]OFX94222.1 MAG: oxidoreductase [Bacteroidetes bacterium GWE2_41_25]OFY59013.1 MAG: oxidoreductase [Bacteroidetes bacterium GWF2_41_9]HAM09681.1 NADPH dehydrogenase NamA [Bacteroidales bacterium]